VVAIVFIVDLLPTEATAAVGKVASVSAMPVLNMVVSWVTRRLIPTP
jgi:hypothetical protein